MHLVHLRLTRSSGPAPVEADAHLLCDALWALTPPGAGVEHIRARAGPEGIDLSLFLRQDIPASDPQTYARILLDTITSGSPPFSAWQIRAGR